MREGERVPLALADVYPGAGRRYAEGVHAQEARDASGRAPHLPLALVVGVAPKIAGLTLGVVGQNRVAILARVIPKTSRFQRFDGLPSSLGQGVQLGRRYRLAVLRLSPFQKRGEPAPRPT